MSAKYKSPSFLLPNELNTSANTANDTGINSLYSMNFDSTTRIPNITGLGLGTSVDTFSISLWFYKSNMNYGILFSAYSGTGSYFQTGVAIELNTNGTIMFFNGAARTTTSAQYSINTWYNLVVTSDGTTVKMYVNGSQVTLDSTTVVARNFTNVWINSAKYSSNNFGITGKIDEVAIFNRALNTTEIAALYDGTGSNIRPSNLMAANLNPIAYYPLGEQAQNSGKLPDTSTNEWQFPNGVLQDYVMDFDGGSVSTLSTYSGLDGANKLTISFWVKSTSAVTSVPLSIGTSPNRQIFVIIQSSNRIVFRKNENGDNTYLRADSGTPHDGNWNHILISMDLTASPRGGIYFNGNNITYQNTLDTNAIQTSTGSLLVGDSANFVGNIAQLAIWSGTDLRNDVATIYNNGSPNDLNNNGLTAPTTWWKLNADSVYTPSTPNYTTALSFNGTTDFIKLNSNTQNFTNFSLSFWCIKGGGHYKSIVGSNASNEGGILKAIVVASGSIRYSDSTNSWVDISGALSSTTWNHILITYNNTGNSLKTYKNGTLITTKNPDYSGSSTNAHSIRYIGARYNTGFFNKYISNVALFDSELTASQALTLFNFGTPETNISFNPTHWWKLDDQTAIIDYGSGGINGTNNGATDTATSVAVVPSWKIPSALPITTTPNYTKAFNFRGSSQNDSIGIGSLSSFQSDVDISNAFSISLWIKTSYTGADSNVLFGNQATSWQPHETTWLRIVSGGYLDFSVLTNPSQPVSNYNRIKNTLDRSINDNKWHHVCCTIGVNPSTTYLVSKVYVDGVLAKKELTTNQGTYQQQINTINNNYYIGARASNVTEEYDGDISNLQIFDSEIPASGSNSVSSLYNGGTPLTSMSGFTSLKGWWKLDDTATFSTNWTIPDASSNNNTGTSSGMTIANRIDSDVLATQPSNGVSTTLPSTALQQSDLQFDSPYSNYSLSFDGTGDYIDCTDNDMFSFGNGATDSPFSISAWIKMDDTSGFRIFNKYAGTTTEYSFGTGGAEKLQFFIFDGANTFFNRARLYNTILNTGQWYHVVATYSGVGGSNAQDGMKIYVDGVKVDDTTISAGAYTAMNNKTTPVYIGKLDTSYANGKIDETAIFNTELTSAQVLEIYNNGRPKDLTTFSGTAPISWWRLGENAYFDNNAITVPNSISGAPNGVGPGTVVNMLSADAPGTYANGIGTNLSILDRVGDAPLSTSNSQSYNMIPDNKSPYVPGYVGLQTDNIYSMSFDAASNTYFNGGNDASLQITGNLTVSMWFKTTATSGYLISDTPAIGGCYSILMGGGNGQLWVRRGNGTNAETTQKTSNTYNDGNWHNITFVSDSTMRIYVDGTLDVQSTVNTPSSIGGFQVLKIGDGFSNFTGQIDEVAIFNTALNAGQIYNDIYQPTATAPGNNKTADLVNNPNLPNPVAWYRMGD